MSGSVQCVGLCLLRYFSDVLQRHGRQPEQSNATYFVRDLQLGATRYKSKVITSLVWCIYYTRLEFIESFPDPLRRIISEFLAIFMRSPADPLPISRRVAGQYYFPPAAHSPVWRKGYSKSFRRVHQTIRSWKTRLKWVALAFKLSVLMTTHMWKPLNV